MSAAAEVAIILFVFFLIGIIVGIIAVIAIPARRPTRRLAARTGQDRPRLRGHITARPCSWRARLISQTLRSATSTHSLPSEVRAVAAT
jgi:hypothetical protein